MYGGVGRYPSKSKTTALRVGVTFRFRAFCIHVGIMIKYLSDFERGTRRHVILAHYLSPQVLEVLLAQGFWVFIHSLELRVSMFRFRGSWSILVVAFRFRSPKLSHVQISRTSTLSIAVTFRFGSTSTTPLDSCCVQILKLLHPVGYCLA